jgi:hypothetical protein
MTWSEMLRIFHKYMGEPNRKIITIPTFIYKIVLKKMVKEREAKNIDGGLNLVEFTKIMTAELFIDKKTIVDNFAVEPDDIEAAIGDSVNLCLAILDGKTTVVGMKGE